MSGISNTSVFPVYDGCYYRTGNYVDYLDRGDRYRRLAVEILPHLRAPILDYGCAVGFLVDALAGLGVEAYGFDVSEWAVGYGRQTLCVPNLTTDWCCVPKEVGTIICLDVLEHMRIESIENMLGSISSYVLIARIPVSGGSGYVLEVSDRDKTHINCLTKDEWESLLFRHGYERAHIFQGEMIWDAPGVLSRTYVKTVCS